MKDNWVKNLARSRFQNNGWVNTNPDKVQKESKSLLLQSIDEIYERCIQAATIYNENALLTDTIKVMQIRPSAKATGGGISLLLGNCVEKVVLHEQTLYVNMEIVKNFESNTIQRYDLSPRMDQLGEVYWASKKLGNLSFEQIVRLLFEDLCKASQFYN